MDAATIENNRNCRRHIRTYFTSKVKSFAMVTSDDEERRRICFFFSSDIFAHHVVCVPNMAHFVQLLFIIGNGIRYMTFYLARIKAFLGYINAIRRMIRGRHDNIEDFFPSMLIHIRRNRFKQVFIAYAPSIAVFACHFGGIVEFIEALG